MNFWCTHSTQTFSQANHAFIQQATKIHSGKRPRAKSSIVTMHATRRENLQSFTKKYVGKHMGQTSMACEVRRGGGGGGGDINNNYMYVLYI